MSQRLKVPAFQDSCQGDKVVTTSSTRLLPQPALIIPSDLESEPLAETRGRSLAPVIPFCDTLPTVGAPFGLAEQPADRERIYPESHKEAGNDESHC